MFAEINIRLKENLFDVKAVREISNFLFVLSKYRERERNKQRVWICEILHEATFIGWIVQGTFFDPRKRIESMFLNSAIFKFLIKSYIGHYVGKVHLLQLAIVFLKIPG